MLRVEPGLWAVCRFTVLCFFLGSYTVTLPAVADSIGSSPEVLAVLQAGGLVGGLFVLSAVNFLHHRVNWGRVQRGCVVLAVLGIAGLAVVDLQSGRSMTSVIIAVICTVPIGFAVALDATILSALMQADVPETHSGSVLTFFTLVGLATIPLSQEVVGLVADLTSVPLALGSLIIIGSIAVLVLPRRPIRAAFDEMNAAEPPALLTRAS